MKKINRVNRFRCILIEPILNIAEGEYTDVVERKIFSTNVRTCYGDVSFSCTGTMGDTS